MRRFGGIGACACLCALDASLLARSGALLHRTHGTDVLCCVKVPAAAATPPAAHRWSNIAPHVGVRCFGYVPRDSKARCALSTEVARSVAFWASEISEAPRSTPGLTSEGL